VPRLKRRSENHKLFREVNERIAELATFDEPGASQSFVCECARVGCNEMVVVPIEVYARVREDADLYVVLRGHEDRANEQTVEDHGAFTVVRAIGVEPGLATGAPAGP
jgi:hypothetical protein